MCLVNFVQYPETRARIVTGYVIAKKGSDGTYYPLMHHTTTGAPLRFWERARTTVDYVNDGSSYVTGFNMFLDLRTARKVFKHFYSNVEGAYTLLKAEGDGVLASGVVCWTIDDGLDARTVIVLRRNLLRELKSPKKRSTK